MKKLFAAMAFFAILSTRATAQTDGSTSTNSQNTNTDKTKEERNKRAVIASFNASMNGDGEAVYKDYDKNIVLYRDGSSAPVNIESDSLKKNFTAGNARWKAAFPNAGHKLITTAADGDYVMVYFKDTGTWKNDFSLWKATGKTYNLNNVMIFKFNDNGKIIEQHAVMPQIELMNQLKDNAEFDLNNTGYLLLGNKKINDAIEVFKLNVKLYPNSGNTYDSLGEAYALAGNKKLAIENYEKSIQIDPANDNGKAMLAKLKK